MEAVGDADRAADHPVVPCKVVVKRTMETDITLEAHDAMFVGTEEGSCIVIDRGSFMEFADAVRDAAEDITGNVVVVFGRRHDGSRYAVFSATHRVATPQAPVASGIPENREP